MAIEKNQLQDARVIKVIDDYTVVINRGKEHGLESFFRVLVYFVDPEELVDPETKESLGNLEIVRGTGKPIHIQDKMATIKSDRILPRPKTIRKNGPYSILMGTEIIEEGPSESLPFDRPQVGDKAKII